jgi:hypothetical protein
MAATTACGACWTQAALYMRQIPSTACSTNAARFMLLATNQHRDMCIQALELKRQRGDVEHVIERCKLFLHACPRHPHNTQLQRSHAMLQILLLECRVQASELAGLERSVLKKLFSRWPYSIAVWNLFSRWLSLYCMSCCLGLVTL